MGAIQFNADEIFTMAEQIEENGAKFYRKAADTFHEHRTLFTRLAEMEDGHYARFSHLHASISIREKEELTADPDGQAAQFAQTYANGHVFNFPNNPSTYITPSSTLDAIFTFAIGLEKDSIIFYLGLKDMVSIASGKDNIDKIIKEEMNHISLLSNELIKHQQK